MTEAEELIQDNKPLTVPGIIALLDGCAEDLSRLMASGEARKSYPLRSLIYRLEQARTEVRAVHEIMNEVFNSLKDKHNG
jgi:hypothetical protein